MKKIQIAALLLGLLTLTLLIIAGRDKLFGDRTGGKKTAENKNSESATSQGLEGEPVVRIEDDTSPYIIPVIEKDPDSETSGNDEEAAGTEKDTGSGPAQADVPESGMEFYDGEAESILERLTLKEKLYQMLILTPEQLTGTEQVTAAGETTKNCIEKYPVGGLIYFAGNLKDPAQTKEMLSKTAEYALETEGVPLFLCIDEEGGRVSRIGSNSSFGVTRIKPMAKIGSEDEAYEAGETIGAYLAELGFNVDFAPDTDVLTNPQNTVIGDRSFGSDPERVVRYAKAYSDGLHDCGMLSTYKHFPGHGATRDDTHEGFAYTNKTMDELMEKELVPFADAQAAGADMIMVSHISVPKILGDNTPCSLSGHMITDILRGEFNYRGLIVTDAMQMGAITKMYGDTQAAVMAVKAGNDLLLMTDSHQAVVAALEKSVNDGEIKEERIDDSVRRIISTKLRLRDREPENENEDTPGE